MPREKRKAIPSLPHLITARAAFGAYLFYYEDDYKSYLSTLRQLVRDRLVTVYAYCLQTEEVRLILEPSRLPLGKVMQRLHGSHSLRVNANMGRHGPLFHGRFDSQPFLDVDLSNAIRSVHLWPVRTGLVRHAEGYRYSSHAIYLGHRENDFVQVDAVLDTFSESRGFAQKSFAKFVESAALEEDSQGFSPILPDPSTQELENLKWKTKKGFLNGLAKRTSLILNLNMANLKGPSRRQDLVMARRLMATIAVLAAGRSVTEVANFLGRDKAQVSRLVSQGMDLLDADEPFRDLYETVWQENKRATNS